jgi:hypothetical protein
VIPSFGVIAMKKAPKKDGKTKGKGIREKLNAAYEEMAKKNGPCK